MLDHDAALDAIVDELRSAGYVEMYTDADGKEAMRLTPEGERVARQLAMTDEVEQHDLMDVLLGDAQT